MFVALAADDLEEDRAGPAKTGRALFACPGVTCGEHGALPNHARAAALGAGRK
ncbi:MAG: hypothetical protein M5U08_23935 [Burkholderiales bacterium]|nr:hypothetical protein [Burkholderiales bacterium]